MGALGFCGSLIYVLSVAAFIFSVVTLQWSTKEISNLTVKGVDTSLDIHMGIFTSKVTVDKGGDIFTVGGYDWCQGGASWDTILSTDDKQTSCYMITAVQAATIGAAALGLCAALMAMLLSCGSIRRHSEKHVAGFTSTLMFFQFVFGAGAVIVWYFLMKDINKRFTTAYGASTRMGLSWYVAIAASALAMVSFFISACRSTKMTYGDLDDMDRPVFHEAKKEQGRASLITNEADEYKHDEEAAAATTY